MIVGMDYVLLLTIASKSNQFPKFFDELFKLISLLIFQRCFHGWTGSNCTECEPLPGCKHGTCIDRANTCICDAGWGGHLCDEPTCE